MAEAGAHTTQPLASPAWTDLWQALGPDPAADLAALLHQAEQGGAKIVRTGAGRLRIDLTPAYPDAADLAAARSRLMPHAATVAAAMRRLAPVPAPGRPAAERATTGPTAARVVRPEPPPTVFIETGAALGVAIEALARHAVIGLDTETTGLNARRDRLRLVQLGVPDAAYVVDTWKVADLAPLAALLASPAVVKVGQNLKFDLGFLRQRGLVEAQGLFDTMLASQLLASGEDGPRHNLAALVGRHLGLALDKGEQASDWSRELTPAQMAYAALDVALLVPLYRVLTEALGRAGMDRAAGIEMAALCAVSALEMSGMAVASDRLGAALADVAAQREVMAGRARALLPPRADGQTRLLPEPVTLTSPAEVAGALRGLGLDIPDAREESLGRYADRPEVAAYSAWRHLDKRFAFLDGLARSVERGESGQSRVYPEYWQIGAATGRMSCSNPNLQQVPRDPAVRSLFAAPPGRALVVADYSQIELRLVAAMSGDRRMREAFAQGQDLHRVTAALLAGKAPDAVTKEERQAAKAANFGLVYSMGARGLMDYARQGYGVSMTLEQASALRERFFAAYDGVVAWHARARREGEATGRTRTVAGRVRRFGQGARAGDYYNAPVQGSGADIFKAALGRVWRAVGPLGASLSAAVHDEIVVECAEAAADEVAEVVRREMEAAAASLVGEVPFPVEVHVARDWSEK